MRRNIRVKNKALNEDLFKEYESAENGEMKKC